jgi:hypothetical protein
MSTPAFEALSLVLAPPRRTRARYWSRLNARPHQAGGIPLDQELILLTKNLH